MPASQPPQTQANPTQTPGKIKMIALKFLLLTLPLSLAATDTLTLALFSDVASCTDFPSGDLTMGIVGECHNFNVEFHTA
jgi:hypothetical protein